MAGLSFDFLVKDKASGTFKNIDRSATKTHRTFGRMSTGVSLGAARISGGIMGIGKSFLGLTAVVGGGAALLKFGQDSVAEAREAEKVGKTTAQVIKATGGAAKITAGQVGSLATALSNKAGIDDEVIQHGENLLLTFKKVRNETGKGNQVFNRATAAAVDLSATGFGSVDSASKMLGKALNDPLKGISALSRAGVTFTAGQKKQIKSLVEHGKTLEAQKVILKEVEQQVGGVAAANATVGEKATVAWGNFKEAIGTAFLPIWNKLLGGFASGLPKVLGFANTVGQKLGPILKTAATWVKAFYNGLRGGHAGGSGAIVTITTAAGKLRDVFISALPWLKKWGDRILNVGQVVGPVLVSTLKQIASTTRSTVAWMIKHRDILEPIAVGILAMVAAYKTYKITMAVAAAATKAYAVAQGVLNAVMALNPIAVVALALVGLAAGLVYAYKHSETFRKIVNAAFAKVKEIASSVIGWFKNSFVPFFTTTIPNAFKAVVDWVKKHWPLLLSILTGPIGAAVIQIIIHRDKITGAFRAAWNWVSRTFRSLWNGAKEIFYKPIRDAYGSITKKFGDLKSFISGWGGKAKTWLYGAGKNVIQGLWDGLLNIWHKVTDWVSGVATWIKKHKGPISLDKTLLHPAGQALMTGLLNGLKFGFKEVGSFVYHVGDTVGGTVQDIAAKIAAGAGSGVKLTPNVKRNRLIAASLLSSFGFGAGQMGPLVSLWNQESGWRENALNKSSGAYGIPQALPASKMASAGGDWRTNPKTQIYWGLNYIKKRYGSPANAWFHEQQFNWYGKGGLITEPVLGIGLRSGQGYGFGEHGVETVTPGRGGVGSGDTYVFNMYGTDPEVQAEKVRQVLVRRQKNGFNLGFKASP